MLDMFLYMYGTSTHRHVLWAPQLDQQALHDVLHVFEALMEGRPLYIASSFDMHSSDVDLLASR